MSENEKPDEKLTPFEAALAGLQPRPDRLDPRWRAILANEVARKTQAGDCPNFRVNENGTVPFAAVQPHAMSPCNAASDHVFACVYCGIRGPNVKPMRRWAWPTAFSAMTAVAASLLLLLVFRADPRIALHGKTVAGSATATRTTDSLAEEPPFEPNQLCYLNIRQQVLLNGLVSWKPSVSPSSPPARADNRSLHYREQLNRFIDQSGSADL